MICYCYIYIYDSVPHKIFILCRALRALIKFPNVQDLHRGKWKSKWLIYKTALVQCRKRRGICGYVLFRHEKFPALSRSKYEYCRTSEQTITFLKSLSLVREILYKCIKPCDTRPHSALASKQHTG